jgi:photosystem II stability/assembly factor-like uncharacterized protein
MISPDEGWIFGGNSTILHYHKGAWKLVEEGMPMPPTMYDLAVVNNREWWAVGAEGTILHYETDRWQLVDNLVNESLLAIDFIDPNEGWAVGINGAILHYAQNKATPRFKVIKTVW